MTTLKKPALIMLLLGFIFCATSAFSPRRPLPRTSTTQRAAVSVPDAVTNFYQTQPYVSAFLTCSIKASAADFVAQGRQSTAKDDSVPDDSNDTTVGVTTPSTTTSVDLPRNLAFFTYGGIYQGCTQQYIFANVYPAWFGHWEDAVLRVAAQVGLDVLVLAPFVCLPILYGIRSLVGASSNEEEKEWHQTYVRDVVQHNLLFKYWALWIPVNAIAFGVIPTHFRVAFIAAVSFVWVLILSLTASNAEEEASSSITAATTSETDDS